MTGLRASVADAIQRDQECGGAGILTDEELIAVEWAILGALKMGFGDPDAKRHHQVLAVLLHELGPRIMSIHGAKNRRDQYWMHCADVAIDAYDRWLADRQAAPVPADA